MVILLFSWFKEGWYHSLSKHNNFEFSYYSTHATSSMHAFYSGSLFFPFSCFCSLFTQWVQVWLPALYHQLWLKVALFSLTSRSQATPYPQWSGIREPLVMPSGLASAHPSWKAVRASSHQWGMHVLTSWYLEMYSCSSSNLTSLAYDIIDYELMMKSVSHIDVHITCILYFNAYAFFIMKFIIVGSF